jgi:ubiquitin-conjugating enzyme E2 J2
MNQGQKRIQKEYRDLLKNPIENIIILPNPKNIYEWHYIILGTEEPYKNGIYYGILTLPIEYPYKAPRIIIKTPNGRFKPDTRLCFSMSDYHQETWNPNWNIRTIMIGFYSFMLEESQTEGSIETSYEERLKYAANSCEFNKKIEIYEELFENMEFEINTKKINEKKIEENENEKKIEENENEKICKFCYESSGILETVCECKGSNQYIHKECLYDWQLKTILNQSTHPKYQINSDIICSVCKTEYKIKGKSRKNLMTELTGEVITEQIKIGYIFISSKESSEKNIELMKEYNDIEFQENMKHWTYGVFFIVENNGGIIALNTNRTIQQSYYMDIYINKYEDYLNRNNLKNKINMENIYIGGPCEDTKIFGLIYIKNIEELNVNLKNVKIIKETENECVIFGEYCFIYKLNEVKPENVTKLHIYLGYAGWGITQLHAEFAKTNWGITNVKMDLLFEKNNYELIEQKNCLFVKKNVYSNN